MAASAIKNVGMVRARLVKGLGRELASFRAWLSAPSLDNAELLDKLNGHEGDELLAGLAEKVLEHLGGATSNQTRKAVTAGRRSARLKNDTEATVD